MLLCGAQQGGVLVDQHYLRATCEPQHGPCGLLKGVMKIVRVPGGLGICGGSFVCRRVVCIGIPEKHSII